MAEKFPYLARQISGNIAKFFGFGIDYVYEGDQEFIDFLKSFSLDNLYGKWLDILGVIIGIQRPWTTIPTPPNSFIFYGPVENPSADDKAFMKQHGFSDKVSSSTAQGGQLDDATPYQQKDRSPIGDVEYRMYIRACCRAKKIHSLAGICDVVESMINSTNYKISFSTEDETNDVLVDLPINLLDYKESLQTAFNAMFTSSPRVYVRTNMDIA